MKTTKQEKEFDSVKMMREIREKISDDVADMTFEDLRAYIDAKLAKKKRLIGQKSVTDRS